MAHILFLLALLAGDILVLKNGKAMRCESYEIKGNQVLVTTKSDVMALPKTMINWQATEKANQAAKAKAKAKADAKAKAKDKEASDKLVGYYEKDHKDKKGVNLTDDSLYGKGFGESNEWVVLQYRRVGNSLIVPVTLNGEGPFDFILDTGASMTMVLPGISSKTGLTMTGKTIPIAGVGGMSRAELAKVDIIGLKAAKVRSLNVAVHDVDAIRAGGFAGLLGQDFLNNFVTNIDPSTQTLSLKKRGGDTSDGSSRGPVESAENVEKTINKFRASIDELRGKILPRLNSITNSFISSKTISASTRKDLLYLDRKASDIVTAGRDFSRVVNQTNSEHKSIRDNPRVQKLLRCHPTFQRLLSDIRNHIKSLRGATASNYMSLAKSLDNMQKTATSYQSCR